MNYFGKKVFHKTFGEGLIIAQDQNGHITVKFDMLSEQKDFAIPACFTSYLQLLDENAAKQAMEELRTQEAIMASEKNQREHEQRLKIFELQMEKKKSKNRSEKKVTVPYYSSINDFFNDQERLIVAEIVYLRHNAGKRQKIIDGEKVETKSGIYIYSFESYSELNLPDNTQISLWQNETEIPATIINCEEFTLTIATATNLGDRVSIIEFSAEPWKLLQFLVERLKSLREANSPIANSLILEGRGKIQFNAPIQTGQDLAVRMSLQQPITFVWGPPGTGKTETLANIAIQHMSIGNRVLMLSFSNVSVDGAIMRVFKKNKERAPGRIIRYGYPRDKELLQHEFLTSYNLVLSKHPELIQERTKLIEERKHTPRSSSRFVEAGTRLSQIRKQLQSEEKKAVSEASFIATTVSKAIADSALYEDRFDTVIFDEASMAYIPQVVFSSGLAGKHFICMGDFSQLPPIVQSGESSVLNSDIFQYCGIVDAVQSGNGHQWLCMLNTQYRMHPDIASFSSRVMYRGLLKTAVGIKEIRQPIANNSPLNGKAIGTIDLSGMMSVCLKTADQSRINVLSAMISMGIAVHLAETHSVGIIAPYSAQARLLHAMSRDVAEHHPELHGIVCATVHQFQGSERDAIIYDAVDCYRMQYPGMLLTSTTNNYANRLYNVALTRARGKMISVVNTNFMRTKNLSQNLMFRQMIDETAFLSTITGNGIVACCDSPVFRMGTGNGFDNMFLDDLAAAKSEVRIDIPGGTSETELLPRISKILYELKQKRIKITIRADSKTSLPAELRSLAIENKYLANPITMIDKNIVWFGLPHSGAQFITEGKSIPTRYRPIFRFEGRHFALALYGFLEMNRTIDQAKEDIDANTNGIYEKFSAYVHGELKCPDCTSPLQLKKGKTGKYFLGCTGYPHCKHIERITEDMVISYFYMRNSDGKKCPYDHTSLEPRIGRYGLFIRCNGLKQHTFNIDEV